MDHLGELEDTYLGVLSHDLRDLDLATEALSTRSAVYVGSGGMFAVAQLGADLHNASAGKLAVAATPLQALTSIAVADAVVLVSASARHPDALTVAQVGARLDKLVILVTVRARSDLPPQLERALDRVLTVPLKHVDAFLATFSVVAMSSALCRVYGHELPLPTEISSLRASPSAPIGWERDRWLITYTPGARMPALDLATRLEETGFRNAQVTDIRDLAHGRHIGLVRRAEETLLVAMTDPAWRGYTEEVLRLVPPSVLRHVIATPLPFPSSAIDLMFAGIGLVGRCAEQQSYDYEPRELPNWGRELFYRPWPA